ncbi:MAG: fructose-bisphosphate aldolase [Nanoarchaeota archaeon]|nr:fructose-bisphosphate aldolase [Nanoarchaeota archaeon]MBU1269570.1 fructose-bisphosphate aldolase [Nanoarchaeota archaeon]MBU1604698.1 fructose-bisphosphate aldolase [Nanoarchaeota archaeon]MBU2443831.1 fructose-bisphosphate aldolase [Nanoarchaeota archaeon]
MGIQINKLLTNGKAIFLAYDQGMEHGPIDFNLKNCDPNYILDIALEGHYNAVILQHGIAEKYYQDYYKDIPLIVKLNGQTNITKLEPISKQLCSVERAIKLGATGVGYTIYSGSEKENEMMVEFSKIVDTAHDYGLPTIAWMYPRGKFVQNQKDTNILAYAARIGAELGADIIKMQYNQDFEGFKWIVKNAGRTKVVISGGEKTEPLEFLKMSSEIMKTGAIGLAVGRNIWQHDKPFSLTKAVQNIVIQGKTVEEAKKFLD